MADKNQTPEQKARDNIDRMLEQAGWKVQNKKMIDFNAGLGIAVREYDTDVAQHDPHIRTDRCCCALQIMVCPAKIFAFQNPA